MLPLHGRSTRVWTDKFEDHYLGFHRGYGDELAGNDGSQAISNAVNGETLTIGADSTTKAIRLIGISYIDGSSDGNFKFTVETVN